MPVPSNIKALAISKPFVIGTLLLCSAATAAWYFKDRLLRLLKHDNKLTTATSTTNTNTTTPKTYKITRLFVYPIKSCFGVELDSSEIEETGLEFDRKWMFVSSENNVLTIREIAEMTLLIPRFEGDKLAISIRGKDVVVKIPLRPTPEQLSTMELVETVLWDAPVNGYAYPAAITAPFSEFFGQEVKLLYKGPHKRLLTANGATKYLGYEGSTDFCDLLPILVANEESVAELNTRLATPITIERFRPNIIVAGSKPWEEDKWKTLKISGRGGNDPIILDVACRAARCLLPNVDPWTAAKDKHQPWDTLMSYRRIDAGSKLKPCFGMLCVPHEGKGGIVRIGDSITIVETTENHKLVDQ